MTRDAAFGLETNSQLVGGGPGAEGGVLVDAVEPPSHLSVLRLAGLGAAFLILSDSAISYPVRLVNPDGGVQVSLLALPIVGLLLLQPLRTRVLSVTYLEWIGLLTIGCLVGYISGGEIDRGYLIQMPSAVFVFLLGYLLRETSVDGRDTATIMLAAGIAHFALSLAIFCRLLPMLDAHDFMMFGQLYRRNFYYADSNYQTFYWTLFPCLLLVRNPAGFVAGLVVNAMGALFYLDIQTRSGLIVFGAQVALALFLRSRQSDHSRRFTVGLVVCLLAGLLLASIPTVSQPFAERLATLGMRFQDDDSVDNIWQRLDSETYLLEKLPTAASFVPIGHAEFVGRTGQVAHAALTSIFLIAGLVGLVAWVALIVAPAWRLAAALIAGPSAAEDNVEVLAFLGMLAIAVTLPTPFQKPFWLVAGILSARLDLAAAASAKEDAR